MKEANVKIAVPLLTIGFAAILGMTSASGVATAGHSERRSAGDAKRPTSYAVTHLGSVVGGIFYVLVDNSAQALSTFIKNDLGLQFDLSAYTVFGILLIVLMYLMPMGIVGGVYYLVQNLRSSVRGGQAQQQAAQKQPAGR